MTAPPTPPTPPRTPGTSGTSGLGATAYDPELLAGSLQALAERRTPLPGSYRELMFPVMVLRADALDSNVATMAAWCRERRVELCPHGKTSMSPELTARQLRAGAWGITAATIGQVRTFVEIGVRRVLLANELVDPVGIAWLARVLGQLPDLTVIGYVDSVAGVELLDRELGSAGFGSGVTAGRRLPVLVEVGLAGERTGARGLLAAREVAGAVERSARLEAVGASAFEGVVGHDRDPETLGTVARLCSDVRTLGLELRADPILSAGGSTYFDVVAGTLVGPEPATVVLRSGGYVTHDDLLYAHATPLPDRDSARFRLRAALDVWAYVLSRPEPTRVLVGAGRRDLPFDAGLPVVRYAESPEGVRRSDPGSASGARGDGGASVVGLNDQHAFLDVDPGSDLTVGDRVCFGISHPCTAFDKWREVPIVDAEGRVLEIAHTLL